MPNNSLDAGGEIAFKASIKVSSTSSIRKSHV